MAAYNVLSSTSAASQTVRNGDFAVTVWSVNGSTVGRTEKGDATYISMLDKTQYKLEFRNNTWEDAEVDVKIDGFDMGTYLFDGNRTFTLETIAPRAAEKAGCPNASGKRFTLLREGSQMANEAGITTGGENNGLVEITIRPEDTTWHRGTAVPACGDGVPAGLTRGATSGSGVVTMGACAAAACAAGACAAGGMAGMGGMGGACAAATSLHSAGTGMTGYTDQTFRQANRLRRTKEPITIVFRLVVGDALPPTPNVVPIGTRVPLPPPPRIETIQ